MLVVFNIPTLLYMCHEKKIKQQYENGKNNELTTEYFLYETKKNNKHQYSFSI